jgi:hypothetical protein
MKTVSIVRTDTRSLGDDDVSPSVNIYSTYVAQVLTNNVDPVAGTVSGHPYRFLGL